MHVFCGKKSVQFSVCVFLIRPIAVVSLLSENNDKILPSDSIRTIVGFVDYPFLGKPVARNTCARKKDLYR